MKINKLLFENFKKISALSTAIVALNTVAFAETDFQAIENFSNHFIQRLEDTTAILEQGSQTFIDETRSEIQILTQSVEAESFTLATVAQENARNLAIQAGKTEAEAKALSEAAAQEVFKDAALVILKFRLLSEDLQGRTTAWLESIRIASNGEAQILSNAIEKVSTTVFEVGNEVSAEAISNLKWAAMEAVSGSNWAEDQAKAYLISSWNTAWNYAAGWIIQAENIAQATEQLALSLFKVWKINQTAESV